MKGKSCGHDPKMKMLAGAAKAKSAEMGKAHERREMLKRLAAKGKK